MRLTCRFLNDTRGNVLMLTGLAILILFAIAGAGVDFGRQQLVRLKLQNASDAAAVAAASMPESVTSEQRRQVALRYFNLNFPTNYLGINRPTPNIQIGNQITVDASTSFNANFVSNVGVERLEANGRTVVDRSEAQSSIYDVILVMDNSNSMAWTTTAPAFAESPTGERQNARNLIQQFCRNDFLSIANTNYVCGSGVFPRPYMADGNLRPQAYGSQTICRQTWPSEMCGNTTMGMVNGLNPYNPAGTGCRPQSSSNGDCYGYGYGLTGDSRLNALRSVALNFVNHIITEGEPGSRIGLITWSSDVSATQPLTNNTATLIQRINQMLGVGATNPVNAMQSAVSMASTFNPGHVKAVVFLTDGAPTLAGPRLANSSTGSDAYGCNGGTFCTQAVNRTLPYCTQLKNNGVQVYTIGFLGFDTAGANRTSAEGFLRNCASTDANGNPRYYSAPTGAELDQAFTQILTSLGRIRISQ